jgi:hypothetical protein
MNPFKVSRLACLAGCLLLAFPLHAQPTVSVGAVEMKPQHHVPAEPGDVADEQEQAIDEGAGRNFEPVVAPIPAYNPVFGWMLSVRAMLIYRPSFAVPEERPWISGAFGFYAENESWGAGLFQRMSFGGDKWRLQGALFHADFNYEYFGIGGETSDLSIDIDQEMDLVMAEALRRIAPDLYLGLKATWAQTLVGPSIPDNLLPPGFDPGRLKLDLSMVTLTPHMEYDTRDSEFYPRSGWLGELDVGISREGLGADLEYERYKFALNHYRPLGESGVLASRVVTEYVGGAAPFFLYPAFGQGSDLRGYQMGTYRDRFLVAAQAEYRHRITPRIGAAAFAGIGSVAPDAFDWGKSLPAVGVGLRWVVAPQNDVSLRFDVARGRDETIWYMSVGEAF